MYDVGSMNRLLDALKSPHLFKSMEITTDKDIQLVRSSLEAAVKPLASTDSLSDTDAVFEGQVSDTDFEIRYIIHSDRSAQNRNSVLPIVKGKLIPLDFGTKAKIDFQLERFAVTFSWVLLLAATVGSCNLLFGILSGELPLVSAVVFLPMAVLVGWVLPRALFWYETEREAYLLLSIIRGDHPSSDAHEIEDAEPQRRGVAKAAYLAIVSAVPPAVACLVGIPISQHGLRLYAVFATIYGIYVWLQPEKDMIYLVSQSVWKMLFLGSLAFGLYLGITGGSLNDAVAGAAVGALLTFTFVPQALTIAAASSLASYAVYRIFVALKWLPEIEVDWNPLRRRKARR
jgi:hypothetical protein